VHKLITAINTAPDSLAAVDVPHRGSIRIALVQQAWLGNMQQQIDSLTSAINQIQDLAPNLIILPELTLYPYACTQPDSQASFIAEKIDGPSYQCARDLAASSNANVVISLFEDARDGQFNTAITVNPAGEIILKMRKTHIPVTAGYYEDKYFDPGNSKPEVVKIKEAVIATPTCWDQWFPELARAYGLLNTDLICFPTAIGSEPDHPEFDTAPLWKTMMVAHGIANGMFVAAVNRIGSEDGISFYGSSFISDPYGRTVLEAPRDEAAILVADLHLDYKKDWLELFPFFRTRRPEMYSSLTTKESK
jgi:N-carbamoylputrescine amidase